MNKSKLLIAFVICSQQAHATENGVALEIEKWEAPGKKAASALINGCKAKAKPTWAAGGRGNFYEGNEEYRTCLKESIQKTAKEVLPADKQEALLKDMDAAAAQITQSYSHMSDAAEKTKRGKAFDPIMDASDLSYYEGLLQALAEARVLLSQK
jgi:hypothetical protein